MKLRIVGVLAVIALAAACGGSSSGSSPKQDVSGTITLVKEGSTSDFCSGSGGYSDIISGAGLTLFDSSSRIIGTASLGVGTSTFDGLSGDCVFKFGFGQVPVTSDFYAVDVGHRGKTTYSKADLQAHNYRIELNLGGTPTVQPSPTASDVPSDSSYVGTWKEIVNGKDTGKYTISKNYDGTLRISCPAVCNYNHFQVHDMNSAFADGGIVFTMTYDNPQGEVS